MYVLILGITLIILISSFVTMSNGTLSATGLVIAVILGIIILKRNFDLTQKLKTKNTKENELVINNVGVGGVFKLANVDGYDEDLTLKVKRKHMYQEGDYFWYELECEKGDGEKAWVEVEEDDELVVSIVLKKLKISEVSGLNPQKLEFDDDNESGSLTYCGNRYNYIDSGKATFYRNCDDKKAETLYYWDYKYCNNLFSVEKWGDNDYEGFYSQIIKPHSITVYSLNAGEK